MNAKKQISGYLVKLENEIKRLNEIYNKHEFKSEKERLDNVSKVDKLIASYIKNRRNYIILCLKDNDINIELLKLLIEDYSYYHDPDDYVGGKYYLRLLGIR